MFFSLILWYPYKKFILISVQIHFAKRPQFLNWSIIFLKRLKMRWNTRFRLRIRTWLGKTRTTSCKNCALDVKHSLQFIYFRKRMATHLEAYGNQFVLDAKVALKNLEPLFKKYGGRSSSFSSSRSSRNGIFKCLNRGPMARSSTRNDLNASSRFDDWPWEIWNSEKGIWFIQEISSENCFLYIRCLIKEVLKENLKVSNKKARILGINFLWNRGFFGKLSSQFSSTFHIVFLFL